MTQKNDVQEAEEVAVVAVAGRGGVAEKVVAEKEVAEFREEEAEKDLEVREMEEDLEEMAKVKRVAEREEEMAKVKRVAKREEEVAKVKRVAEREDEVKVMKAENMGMSVRERATEAAVKVGVTPTPQCSHWPSYFRMCFESCKKI
ncbi:hypothetical protein CYMTET_47673 [Cymbomonas tetramitiformis]|uniref:Uncharacterized protein n=1 Tax=Cymbomonas tetramitiformis TaxID=36881 RepID=A0AAE0EXH6_9CHLO|nr:hypothetical protein CYMTET_47673 [Cymbomonas tetramitiformis]